MRQIAAQIIADELTVGIILFIAVLWMLGAFLAILSRWIPNDDASYRLHRFAAFIPGAMTTIGVIGTFVGIFVGLVDFNVEDIDSSVPALLSGLKIAFATSIAGMIAAISFRLFEHFGRLLFGSRPARAGSHDALTLLARLNDLIEDQNRSIGGDGDSSLLTTLKLTRSEALDSARKQLEAFESFAESMKDSATGAIVEALEQVIRDFNQRINEQFGENFAQLNQAVAALNTWQQNYKEQVERNEEKLGRLIESISEIDSHISRISENIKKTAEHARVLPEVAEKIGEANEMVLENLGGMKGMLDSIESIKSNADVFLPRIEESVAGVAKALETSSDELNIQLKNSLEQAHNGMKANFQTFDEQMQQELTKVLEEMGTKLSSLSGKFVDDYGPLTEKLRDVVRMANGAAR